jgi:zinc protease
MLARRLLACAALLFAIASPHGVLAAIDATTTTLGNGLTVIIAPVHAAPVATVGVLYKVGSRNETPWTTGVAHQVEHMMFKGTTDLLKPGDIDRRFIDNNAQTDQDSTYYYESFQKDGLGNALRIEADRMANAAFDPAQLVSENAVVLEELDSAHGNPADLLDEQVEPAAMQAHQYHWPTIGWRNVVETFASRRDLVYDFYVHHYAPQNAVLVIAGDVDPATTLALVHTYFDPVAQRPVSPLERIAEPAQHGVRRVNVVGPGSSDRIEMAYHVPGFYTDDSYVLQVLDGVLAGGQSSRLYQALVEGGLASDLNTTPNQAIDPYVYTIAATLEDGVSHDQVRAAVEAELRKLVRAGVGDAELRKAKKQVIAAYVFSHDGIEARAQQLAYWQAWTGDWRNDERYAAKIQAVTAAQVREAARRYLASDNLTIGTFTATGGAPAPAAGRPTHRFGSRARAPERSNPLARGGAFARDSSTRAQSAKSRDAEASPHPAAAVGATAATPSRFVLSNGLVLVVQENHANPSAVISTDTSAGSAYDPAARSGLAALTQEMLMRGTTSRSYSKLQSDIDALGTSIDTSIGVPDASTSTQTLAEDEPTAMVLLADVLQHPSFEAAEFERARDQLTLDRRSAADDAAAVARDKLYRALYPSDDPWSHPSEGTIPGLTSVRLGDVRTFYRNRYGPNDTVIVVVGDVDAETVRAQVDRLFGSWRRVTQLGAHLAGAGAAGDTRTITTVMAGKSQVEVMAGAAGLSTDAPDHDAAMLMNFILGGESFVSKLLHQVRDVDGYVYSIGSRFSQTSVGGGPWIMAFGASPRYVSKAIAESVGQMRTLQSNALSDDELAEYGRLAIDSAITGDLSNTGIASDLTRDERLGRGLDYAQRLPQIYAAVTPAQVQAAAQKYLHPDGLVISTAGPKY